MRINRLSIFGKYKNIQTGVLVLSDNNYTALVGANGSGKSNWIEIMASIMQHLLDNIAPDFGYRLIMHDEKEVRFKDGMMNYLQGNTGISREDIDLPHRLIVCYSGEDPRLWDSILMKSYSQYFRAAAISLMVEPKCLYLNRYHWGIALITLLCSNDEEVQSFVETLWGRNIQLNQIKVKIELDPTATGYTDPVFVKLLDQIRGEETLYMSHVASFDINMAGRSNLETCRRLYYLLYALSMPVPNAQRGIGMKKAITNIELETEEGLSLTSMSEGHKKRILIMLMTKILGDDHTVYLIDEPDAHVDVGAKKDILDLIEQAEGQVVLTTHSPLMTKNMQPESVQTVDDGFVANEEWSKILKHLSANQVANVENFLFTFNRKVIITEGKDDINFIRQAIKRLSPAHPDLNKLNNVASFGQNGTGGTKFFVENNLLPVIEYFEKVVFLFDNDESGRTGYDELNRLIRKNRPLAGKVTGILYSDDYTREIGHDFIIEDFFPANCYQGKEEVPNYNFAGYPPYYEIKKMSNAAAQIKGYIERHYTDEDFDSNVYAKFLPLLNKLIQELGL